MKKDDLAEFQEDLQIFLIELDEILADTERNLVDLERSPDAALVQEVFRAMHTVKGGAATLGLDDAVEVTHTMESIMERVRSGEQELTSEMVDALFHVLDWLKMWKVSLEEHIDSPPAEDLIKEMQRFVLEPHTESAKVKTRPADGKHTLGEELNQKLDEYLSQNMPVYEVVVKFRPDADLLSVRCFQVFTLVSEAVDVIFSEPSVDEMESDDVGDVLTMYISCEDGGEMARQIAGSVGDVIEVSVTPYKPTNAPEVGRESPDATVKTSSLGRTVRVDVELLDFLMNMIGELVIDRTRLTQLASRLLVDKDTAVIGNELAALASHLQRTSQELQEGIMKARLLPLKNIFSKFPRMIRDLANRCGKQIDLEIRGENTELDRTVLEVIDDPLIHILRNAVDHGIETPEERRHMGKPERGKVILSAWHEENQVVIEITDDGAGMDPEALKRSAVNKGLVSVEEAGRLSEKEALELIFMPGFSTAKVATQVSGRGVGMDVVRTNLERINGHVEVRSRLGVGTTFTLKLPLTLAIMRALLVECSGCIYAIPTSSVEEAITVSKDGIQTIKGKPTLLVRGRIFPFVSLEGVLNDDPWAHQHGLQYAVLTRSNGEALALGVDDLIGEEEIVLKDMGKMLARLKGIAGATILPDGDPALILDVNRLL
ncbi:MAG TPA: chemotaxis protein CheA [Bacillota bacterium]|nr:chemotaxis protein CheA [Bacillota bacterium]